MPIDAPIDPTARAIIAFLEVGVVGAVLLALMTGKFRHDREIKREEKATAEVEERIAEVEKQRDQAIEMAKAQTQATAELGTAVKTLVTHVEQLTKQLTSGRQQ